MTCFAAGNPSQSRTIRSNGCWETRSMKRSTSSISESSISCGERASRTTEVNCASLERTAALRLWAMGYRKYDPKLGRTLLTSQVLLGCIRVPRLSHGKTLAHSFDTPPHDC